MAAQSLQHESVPAITGNPLEPFALAWLARWTHFGASARLSRVCEIDANPSAVERQLSTCFPTYHFSPVYEDDEDLIAQSPDWPESLLRDLRSFNCHFYDGKVRELHDLIDAVPSGFDAVRALIEVLPELGNGRPLRRDPFANRKAGAA